jgi:hypothetical protein
VQLYEQCGDQWRFCRDTGRMVIDNSNIMATMQAMGADGPDRQHIFTTVKLIIGEIARLWQDKISPDKERKRTNNGATENRPGRR